MPKKLNMKERYSAKLYDLWAAFYDSTFGQLVHSRQQHALKQLRPNPGDLILDIGVGTGMTLPHYPDNCTVVGMDLSGGMLEKAAEKIQASNLTHCSLVQGDAMFPPFAPQSFDHIIITHTISVVSEPAKLLRWGRNPHQTHRPHRHPQPFPIRQPIHWLVGTHPQPILPKNRLAIRPPTRRMSRRLPTPHPLPLQNLSL